MFREPLVEGGGGSGQRRCLYFLCDLRVVSIMVLTAPFPVVQPGLGDLVDGMGAF
jgi:hypothetical protein